MKYLTGVQLMFCYLFATTSIHAQKFDNNWVTGVPGTFSMTTAGNLISFKDSVAVLETPIGCNSSGANASFSTNGGDLLFHTNGIAVYDKNGILVENGYGINKESSVYFNSYKFGGYPIANSVQFVPAPDQPDLVYLFHQSLGDNPNSIFILIHRLYLTKIQPSANNGLGKVLEKNIPLMDGDFEVYSMVRHGNGRDWWILMPDAHDQRYSRLLVSPTGVSSPISQDIGFQTTTYSVNYAEKLFSPDGKKYVNHSHWEGTSIFDFDRCTGLLSNPVFIPTEWLFYGGGAAISPNSRYLYVDGCKEEWHGCKLWQYDLNATDIASTITEIAFVDYGMEVTPGDTSQSFGYMELAPDNKIYLGGAVQTFAKQFFHVIDSPDSAGLACNVRMNENGLLLKAQSSFSGLPCFPNYRLYDFPDSPCDTLGIDGPPMVGLSDLGEGQEIKVFPNPAADVLSIQFGSLETTEKITIQVHDLVGKTVMNQSLAFQPLIQFVLPVMPNGVYFVHVLDEDGAKISTNKLIVQH